MINFRDVTPKNFHACIKLSVSDTQKHFVASNVYSLAQAYTQKECKPRAIYDDDTIVGFLMYCIDTDDHEYWIYRFMIDTNYQRNNYGRQALKALIKIIKKDKTHNKIYLGTKKSNTTALKLYESVGFVFTGRIEEGEWILALKY
ncbi:MAG: GNAT family N-acetyltransferase [Clostridiales bacterium]|nr:GNAT family N-acetyltransferase [Clostridiales bacterium]